MNTVMKTITESTAAAMYIMSHFGSSSSALSSAASSGLSGWLGGATGRSGGF